MLRAIALCALLLSLPATASATTDGDSANANMRGCRAYVASDDVKNWPYSQGYCSGHIAGITALISGVCAPAGVTHGQTVRTVTAYIEARPSRHHENFTALVIEALKSTWPCRRGAVQ